MLILSHRGYWKRDEEKNTPIAFERTFRLGFGTELDVRDYCGRLVISHDIPNPGSMDFKALLDVYCEFDKGLFLAINIKADGLQELLLDTLNEYQIENYFVFDMAVPDSLEYLNLGMKVFTRESEFETEPLFYEQADGVWMDEFRTPWITPQRIKHHLDNGKKVCIVSPELHQMDHLERWKDYMVVSKNLDKRDLMLCTDNIEETRRYFND
jgi:glycerophosphoryl diester phosphodiesterase